MITIDEFSRIEMRVGLVYEASGVEKSDKLIRLSVDFGSERKVVFTGVRKWFEPEYFVNKKFVFVINLTPRPMMGEESQGMILAAEREDGVPIFLTTREEVDAGSKVR